MRISKDGKFQFSIPPELHEEVCKEYLSGSKVSKLALKYNCSNNTILRILNRNNISIRSISHNIRKYYLNDNYFDIIDTEQKAYFLGLLYADGYNYEKNGCIELALQASDKEFLEDVKSLITKKPLYHIKSKDETIIAGRKTNQQDSYKMSVYSKQLSSSLKKLGCFQNKSLTLKFPTYDQVPDDLMIHFIRGYFDGDGCICYNKYNGYLKISILFYGTYDFLNGIAKFLFKKYNINILPIRLERNLHRIVYSSKTDANIIYHAFYDNASIFMPRKKQKFNDIGII